MKFLIDAQLPRRLTTHLNQAGFEATHTLDLPDGNHTTDRALIDLSFTGRGGGYEGFRLRGIVSVKTRAVEVVVGINR